MRGNERNRASQTILFKNHFLFTSRIVISNSIRLRRTSRLRKSIQHRNKTLTISRKVRKRSLRRLTATNLSSLSRKSLTVSVRKLRAHCKRLRLPGLKGKIHDAFCCFQDDKQTHGASEARLQSQPIRLGDVGVAVQLLIKLSAQRLGRVGHPFAHFPVLEGSGAPAMQSRLPVSTEIT